MWSITKTKPAVINDRRTWLALSNHLFLRMWQDLTFHSSVSRSWQTVGRILAQRSSLAMGPYLSRPSEKNPLHFNSLASDFKLMRRTVSTGTPIVEPSPHKPQLLRNLRKSSDDMDLFRTYLRVTSVSSTGLFAVHPHFRFMFLRHSASASTVASISGVLTRWQSAYYFLFNLFYFNMEVMVFGTSFFKKELLSFNWKTTNHLKFMWRYTLPFLFLRSNKITNYGYFVFNRLRMLGMRTAFVVDVLYHNKTLYYLHRSNFYTLGVVPTNYSPFLVNFAIPTAVDSVFTQLFFVRFVIRVRQASQAWRYSLSKSEWLAFYSRLS